MTTAVFILLALAALAAAKNLPAIAVLGVVTAMALVMRRQVAANTAGILALAPPEDPWAKPSAEARRLMKRSLSLALSRTELASCFPGRVF